jgi:hypothetical protein
LCHGHSHDTSVLRRGSASHSRDKVNRKILAIKSAAFLKKISLCFDIEPRKITGSNVPNINLRSAAQARHYRCDLDSVHVMPEQRLLLANPELRRLSRGRETLQSNRAG